MCVVPRQRQRASQHGLQQIPVPSTMLVRLTRSHTHACHLPAGMGVNEALRLKIAGGTEAGGRGAYAWCLRAVRCCGGNAAAGSVRSLVHKHNCQAHQPVGLAAAQKVPPSNSSSSTTCLLRKIAPCCCFCPLLGQTGSALAGCSRLPSSLELPATHTAGRRAMPAAACPCLHWVH